MQIQRVTYYKLFQYSTYKSIRTLRRFPQMGPINHFVWKLFLEHFWRTLITLSVSICLLEILFGKVSCWGLGNLLFVSPSLSLESFIIFSLFVVKVSGASKQKSSCRTSSSSTSLTGNNFLMSISAAVFDF